MARPDRSSNRRSRHCAGATGRLIASFGRHDATDTTHGGGRYIRRDSELITRLRACMCLVQPSRMVYALRCRWHYASTGSSASLACARASRPPNSPPPAKLYPGPTTQIVKTVSATKKRETVPRGPRRSFAQHPSKHSESRHWPLCDVCDVLEKVPYVPLGMSWCSLSLLRSSLYLLMRSR